MARGLIAAPRSRARAPVPSTAHRGHRPVLAAPRPCCLRGAGGFVRQASPARRRSLSRVFSPKQCRSSAESQEGLWVKRIGESRLDRFVTEKERPGELALMGDLREERPAGQADDRARGRVAAPLPRDHSRGVRVQGGGDQVAAVCRQRVQRVAGQPVRVLVEQKRADAVLRGLLQHRGKVPFDRAVVGLDLVEKDIEREALLGAAKRGPSRRAASRTRGGSRRACPSLRRRRGRRARSCRSFIARAMS